MVTEATRHPLERLLGLSFTDSTLLQEALTHKSAGTPNYERLEFLGDSVLSLVITDFLYHRFPEVREGDLSRMRASLVRAESLSEVAKTLELGNEILLGQGEMKSGGHRRDSILGDTVEALIGAVYLDSDIDSARTCILRWFAGLLVAIEEVKPVKDAKTSLQEFLQQRGHSLPEYRVIDTGGEAHNRQFTVSCKIDLLDREFTATATSRRKAEQLVAEKFLATLEIE